jgi:hypothetical protein
MGATNGGAPVAKDYVRVDSGMPAAVWLIGWLFTLGLLHLTTKQALLGLIIWAYYLGKHFAHVGP